MEIIQYILISTICLTIAYPVYHLMFRGSKGFREMRVFLLAGIAFSLVIPFSSLSLDIGLTGNPIATVMHPDALLGSDEPVTDVQSITLESTLQTSENRNESINLNWPAVISGLYILVFTLLVGRMIAQLLILIVIFIRSKKQREGRYVIVSGNYFKSSFSFFNWIFLQTDSFTEEERDQVISHEKIHASQYHSFDLILIELLAAMMWFNPIVWMMRKSIQLVHEYLADEGVLRKGISKTDYQTLIINQVAEGRLICLSSSFNSSLIKKRMIMMNKPNFSRGAKIRILALIPLAAMLIITVACIKTNENTNPVTAVELVRMNVLYVGVDNPVKIAASGYETSELEATIDNGTITGSNGEYSIHPKESGKAVLTVKCKGKEIQKTEFRVKFVPDPVAALKLAGDAANDIKSDGSISKSELLSAGGVNVVLKNFDFDLNFKIVSFVMSVTLPDSYTIREEISRSDRYSEGQVNLIKSLKKNQKLIIENIIAVGPDGKQRKLNSIVFNISGE